jgi:hypothetical protein
MVLIGAPYQLLIFYRSMKRIDHQSQHPTASANQLSISISISYTRHTCPASVRTIPASHHVARKEIYNLYAGSWIACGEVRSVRKRHLFGRPIACTTRSPASPRPQTCTRRCEASNLHCELRIYLNSTLALVL